jgi:hypothetical protein
MTECNYGDIEKVKDLLKVEPLEDFSRVNRHPKWLSKQSEERYKGCASIHGNFKRVSCAFSFITDDEKLIAEFEDLFKKNKEIKNGNPF